MIIEKIKAKSLINRSSPGLSQISMNPYQGCYHNCCYCDGKSESYYMHEDFAERIKVKMNAPKLFEQYLKKQGFHPIFRKGTTTLDEFFPRKSNSSTTPKHTLCSSGSNPKFIAFIGGGICDVYQPTEKKLKITRKLLKIAYEYDIPIETLTKSKLVLRDLDLISKIHQNTYACVSTTITLANEDFQKIFEPRASTTSERFKVIEQYTKAGIPAGIYASPLLPFIGDTQENIEQLFKRAKKVDASFVGTWGLTLKPGRNKREFFEVLKEYFPERLEQYKQLYSNNNKYGLYDSKKYKEFGLPDLKIVGYKMQQKYGIPNFIPLYIPQGSLDFNLRLAFILKRISELKIILKKDYSSSKLFRKASLLINDHIKDLSSRSSSFFTDLGVNKIVLPTILEYVKERKCSFLEELGEFNQLFINK